MPVSSDGHFLPDGLQVLHGETLRMRFTIDDRKGWSEFTLDPEKGAVDQIYPVVDE